MFPGALQGLLIVMPESVLGNHTKSVPCSVHECCSVAECSRPEVVAFGVKIRALGNHEIKEHSCLPESTLKGNFH